MINEKSSDNTINVKNYGAKGDGVSDDTQAFINALAELKNNGRFNVPDGIYRVNGISISQKKNCTFVITGIIKPLDGADISQVVSIISCDGSNFYGLNIDGNRDNVVNRLNNGDQPNLIIGAGQKNINFYNTTLSHSNYCGVVYNGKCENVNFENAVLNDIGEHCFYISGGENINCSFKNITANDIGRNSYIISKNHDCYAFKIRGSVYGSNQNLCFEKVKLTQVPSPIITAVFVLLDIIGLKARKITSMDVPLMVLSDKNVTDVFFDELVVCSLVYNITGQPKIDNIVVSNSRIGKAEGIHINYVNLFKKLNNCIFINCRLTTNVLPATVTHQKTLFKGCSILDNTHRYRIAFDVIDRDIEFIDCIINPSKMSADSPLFLVANSTNALPGKKLTFKNTEINCSTWSYSIGVYNPINVNIYNSKIDRPIRTYNGVKIPLIKLLDVTTMVNSKLLETITHYEKVVANNILDVNGRNLTKLNIEATINSGSLFSEWIMVDYFIFNPEKYNILVSLSSNPSGINNFWVNFDDEGNRFRIEVDIAPTQKVTSSVRVEVSELTVGKIKN